MDEVLNTNTNSQATVIDVSFDELLDDTVGLSFKSVRSIWLLFKNPLEYFTAAKTPFWHNKFSPSFRIYAGLLALSTGMRFLWRDEGSPIVRVYTQLFQQVKENPPKDVDPAVIDPAAMAITTLKWYILIMPIAAVIFYIFLGLIYWGYGEKLNPVVRIRNVFAMMIPASVIGLVSILPMYYTPTAITGLVSYLAVAVMFGMVWITAYRGAFPAVPTKAGRAGRATAITALNFTFTMLATVLAVVVGIVMATKEALAAGAIN